MSLIAYLIFGALLAGVLLTLTIDFLTEKSLKDELVKRQEIKNKKITDVLFKEFIPKAGFTEVTLTALNAQKQNVGTIKVQAKKHSGVYKGQKIAIPC